MSAQDRGGRRQPTGLVSHLRRQPAVEPVPGGFGEREPADLRRLEQPTAIVLAGVALMAAVGVSVAGAPVRSVAVA
jgi:hypothetical protein